MQRTSGRPSGRYILAVVLSICGMAVVGILVHGVWREVRGIQVRRTRLLCETDYDELLAACRELMQRVAAGELDEGQYNIRIDVDRDRRSSSFPKVILGLEPTYVDVSPDLVIIELFGLTRHLGVFAVSESRLAIYGTPGDLELVPGLGYHDDAFLDDPSEYEKTEALIDKAKHSAPNNQRDP